MKPVLQALLVADRVYQDKQTGKMIICGVFNRMLVVPRSDLRKSITSPEGLKQTLITGGMQSGSPTAYLSVTEVNGELPFKLQYVSRATDEVFFELDFKLKCNDPLQTIELLFPLPPLPPIEGVHALELLCDGDPLGYHRITVSQKLEPSDESNDR